MLIIDFFFFWLQAAILQHTAEYINQLQQERDKLIEKYCGGKTVIIKDEERQMSIEETTETSLSPTAYTKKRKLTEQSGEYLNF